MNQKEIIENYLFGNNYLENHIRPPMKVEILGKPLTDTIIQQAIDRLKKRIGFDIEVSYIRTDANSLQLTINGNSYALSN